MTTEAVGRQQEGVLAGDGAIYEVAPPGPRSDREHLSRVLSGRSPPSPPSSMAALEVVSTPSLERRASQAEKPLGGIPGW